MLYYDVVAEMIKKTELYLRETLDDNVIIKEWQGVHILPISLRETYNFYETTVDGTDILLMEVIRKIPRIELIKKHMKRLSVLSSRKVVLYHREITRHRRKVYIVNRIPFIIENGQLYLPFIGMDIKPTIAKAEDDSSAFTPAAQVAYLYFLYHKDSVLSTGDYAKKLHVTDMTASRALNELHAKSLVMYEIVGKTGRSKLYRRISDPEYLRRGRLLLRSPVNKVVYVNKLPDHTLGAGMEALAAISAINSPGHRIRAISREDYKRQKIDICEDPGIIDEADLIELQIWAYDPELFGNKGIVDIMSLYASLQDAHDERIEKELELLLKGLEW